MREQPASHGLLDTRDESQGCGIEHIGRWSAPDMTDRKQPRGGGRSRLMGLGVLVGLVALAMAYFGNCIPGFGVGGSTTPSSSREPATKADAAKAESAASGLRVVVDGDRCRRASGSPEPCDELCRALAAEAKTQRIEIEGTLGTHAAVDGLRKCLAEQGFRDVVVRAE
jgi:hypothetical protein